MNSEDQQTCGIAFGRREIDDQDGCINPEGHDGPHRCIDTNGTVYEWETDLECNCECCQSDDWSDYCILYWEVNEN